MYSPVNNAVACEMVDVRSNSQIFERTDDGPTAADATGVKSSLPRCLSIYSSRFETTLATSTCSFGTLTRGLVK